MLQLVVMIGKLKLHKCDNSSADILRETEGMKTEPSVKLIKKGRKALEPQAKAKSAAGPNRWATSVQSWVRAFQNQRRDESLRAFDSLFK